MEGTVEVGVEALEEDEDGFLSAASASLMSRLPEGLRSFSSRNCEVKPKWSHTHGKLILTIYALESFTQFKMTVVGLERRECVRGRRRYCSSCI